MQSGADLGGGGGGGGGGRPPPPLGDSTPCRPKGPPFDTFSEIHFWPTDPKIFLKFKGDCAPKKMRFFCQNFSKSAQKRLFLLVFSKICLRRTKFCKNRGKTVLWESSKNQFGRLKKKSSKFSNYPPPLEKILDPPLDAVNFVPGMFRSFCIYFTFLKKAKQVF